tara:strand:- start:1818 stop:2048 length:231 start_codon:yes stop_codon:yes gene_type:complete
MHPLVNDLSEFTTPQLQEKIVSLQKKYFAMNNAQVQNQIVLLIDTYNLEIERRQRSKDKKEPNKDNNDLDKLINIS